MAIAQAAKERKVRVVAIAKDRFNAEKFTREYWAPPAELYFDSAKSLYPFFRHSNGQTQGLLKLIASFLFRGQVYHNLKQVEGIIPSDTKGAASSLLGSLIVVSHTGDILFHHKEKEFGDQPDPRELRAAIRKLGESGVVSCECGEDED